MPDSIDSTPSNLVDRNGDAAYKAPRVQCAISDFEMLRRAGDGSFSTVAKSRYKKDGNIYALKIVDKGFVMRQKHLTRVLLERNVLDKLQDDGIVKLKFTFQDHTNLYFVMEYIPGGELFTQIEKKKGLDLSEARFYAAEVVLILEYLRKQNLIHRDLKPENLLLTAEGHLKLVDFGCVKDLSSTEAIHETSRRTSFVGTADYIAPETLRNEEITYAADLWGLGCLIFQMFAGKPPFRGSSEYYTYEKISKMDYSFPADFPSTARRLVEALLHSDPQSRIGATNLADLKRHEFFEGIAWTILRRLEAPRFLPRDATDEEDAAELDWELNSVKDAVLRQIDPRLSKEVKDFVE